MRKSKPRGERKCCGDLRNSKMPSSFMHSIRAPADEEERDRCSGKRNCANPSDQSHVCPAGKPLQDCWEPKPKGVATNISEKERGGQNQCRWMSQRLPDRHSYDMCFRGALVSQSGVDPVPFGCE